MLFLSLFQQRNCQKNLGKRKEKNSSMSLFLSALGHVIVCVLKLYLLELLNCVPFLVVCLLPCLKIFAFPTGGDVLVIMFRSGELWKKGN